MNPEIEKLVRDLLEEHNKVIRQVLADYNDYPVIPDSVHSYTSMYLAGVKDIIAAAKT